MQTQRDSLSTISNAEVRIPTQAVVAAIDRLTAATERQAQAIETLVAVFRGLEESTHGVEDSLDFLAR